MLFQAKHVCVHEWFTMSGERADVVLTVFNSFIVKVRDRADTWLDFIKHLFGPIDL